jgi:hypothetical protein
VALHLVLMNQNVAMGLQRVAFAAFNSAVAAAAAVPLRKGKEISCLVATNE